jgi:hypothetical protein
MFFALCSIAQHQNGIALKNVIPNHMALKNNLTKKRSLVKMPTYGLKNWPFKIEFKTGQILIICYAA